MNATHNPRLRHTGPGFVTLYPEPEPAPRRDRFSPETSPVSHLFVRIRAEWVSHTPAPVRPLVDWVFPPIDSARVPLAYCGQYGAASFECDAYPEHAPQILAAVMRLRPARVSVHSGSR